MYTTIRTYVALSIPYNFNKIRSFVPVIPIQLQNVPFVRLIT